LAETKNNSVTKTTYMSNNNTIDRVMGSMSTEEYERLHSIRESTMVDPQYIQWVTALRVSQSYEDPTGKIKARELMSEWNPKRLAIVQM
jgi:hypothetical protein